MWGPGGREVTTVPNVPTAMPPSLQVHAWKLTARSPGPGDPSAARPPLAGIFSCAPLHRYCPPGATGPARLLPAKTCEHSKSMHLRSSEEGNRAPKGQGRGWGRHGPGLRPGAFPEPLENPLRSASVCVSQTHRCATQADAPPYPAGPSHCHSYGLTNCSLLETFTAQRFKSLRI